MRIDSSGRRLRGLLILPLAMSLAGCPFMQVQQEDPYAVRVRELEAQVKQMERVLDNQSLLQLLAEIERLQKEVRRLTGELETLRYDTDGMRERQRDLYVDLDQRLQELESGASNASSGSTQSDDGNDRAAYQAALALVQQSRYQEAEKAYRAFLENYPNSGLRPNAHYWLGEIAYVNKQFDKALQEFRGGAEQYPDSSKAPDLLLKAGYTYDELGDAAKARATLEAVQQRFPDHRAARLASARLERMADQGR
ncbi:MAG: tol-pal system protein YbgF [Gammaproteobacteria bacterium]|nr:tol-pal system protein YbgF [Gammaproteobacteria bacterium]